MCHASILIFRIFIIYKRHDAHGKFASPTAEFLVRTIRIIIQIRHTVAYNMTMKFLLAVVIYTDSIKRIFATQHKFDDRAIMPCLCIRIDLFQSSINRIPARRRIIRTAIPLDILLFIGQNLFLLPIVFARFIHNAIIIFLIFVVFLTAKAIPINSAAHLQYSFYMIS